ncbi:hypothetical protein GM661_18070 [Iocasia frigidifontis]|uniref:Uncharacterized protein n=1 Tax=Iocasia fonsfrigidae TaxID=2682810 RepID=A0A8A7KCZ8_9FIRM|nr:hypothetical protein [Iocasia fonsfrigidae]QTL99723.1 hypothetical protein GM661_18070 [Iocasia fonsfrigidae]
MDQYRAKIKSSFYLLRNKLYSLRPIKIDIEPIVINNTNKIEGVYIVATKRGLFILRNNKLYKILQGRFYGITKYNDNLYIFERLGNLKGRIIHLALNKNYSFQKDGKILIDNISPGCHQIDFINNYLYITDSYNNRILKCDLQNIDCDEFYPLGKLKNGRNSKNYGHINSIYKKEKEFLLMCHNETTKTGRNSEILVLDENLNINRKIDTKASNAHNIVKYKEQLFYCDSMNMSLMKNGVQVFRGKHFMRGLSVTDEYLLVGGSDYAKRNKRTKVNGYIYILDHKFRLIDSYLIPGMVQEIRRIDNIDYSLSQFNED